MPIEVKAFSCAFKCGSHVQTKRKRIEEHEKRCSMNPDRRTCKTCRHDVRGGREEGIYCAIEKKPATLPYMDDMHLPVTLMYDCPFWEKKVAP